MSQTANHRAFALTKHMLAGYMYFNVWVWAGFVAAVGALIVGVAVFRGIEVSGWEQAATQVPRWYLLFIGAHLANPVLPLHIAHGQTRRIFAQQLVLFIVAFAGFGAALITAGFLLEAALYALAGWPHGLSLSHLFTSPDDVHLIFIEFWLRFAVWLSAGVLLGTGFYRERRLGGIAIPAVIISIAAAEMALAPGDWWPFGDVPPFLEFGITSVPLLVGILVPMLSASLLAAIAWLVVRDMPLKNKSV